MATKTKSRSKAKSRSKSKTRTSNRPGSGIRVKREMLSPKVAQVTVELDWEELVSRVIKKLGKSVKKRRTKRTRAKRSRRATASS